MPAAILIEESVVPQLSVCGAVQHIVLIFIVYGALQRIRNSCLNGRVLLSKLLSDGLAPLDSLSDLVDLADKSFLFLNGHDGNNLLLGSLADNTLSLRLSLLL